MSSFEPPSVYHPAPAARPRSTSPSPRSSLPRSSASSDSLAPPRIVLFSGALEDTFRIPASDSATTTAWRARRTRRRASREDLSADDDPDSIVVIPPLGDREVENNVRRLLGHHGVRARTTVLDAESDPREPLDGAGDGSRDREREGDEMDVDELETDCLSSHNPSRASSPVQASPRIQGYSPGIAGSPGREPSPPLFMQTPATSAIRMSQAFEGVRSPRPATLLRRESGYISRRPSSHLRQQARRTRAETAHDQVDVDQDLAGICFDPTGRYLYVASTNGVAEWTVRGAEKNWWVDSAWA